MKPVDNLTLLKIAALTFGGFIAVSCGVAVYNGYWTGRLTYLSSTYSEANHSGAFWFNMIEQTFFAVITGVPLVAATIRIFLRIARGQPLNSPAEDQKIRELMEDIKARRRNR